MSGEAKRGCALCDRPDGAKGNFQAMSGGYRPAAVLLLAGFGTRYLTFELIGSERQFPTQNRHAPGRIGRPILDVRAHRQGTAIADPLRSSSSPIRVPKSSH